MADETIVIDVQGEFVLTQEMVWPDGVPENWSIGDVVSVMKDHAGAAALVDAWNLGDGLDTRVTVTKPNPAYAGGHVLFGDPPSELSIVSERVW